MKKTYCTHCKTEIICNTEDISQCDCKKVSIQPETTYFLGSTFHKCLCNACLSKFDDLVTYAKTHELPKKRSEMDEGVHYYMENNYFVFTELYHLMKGQCCQNGCRHCVYGFKNQYL